MFHLTLSPKNTGFLDVSFNLVTKEYRPFRIPGHNPLYVNVNSNHPKTVIDAIPDMINKRISAADPGVIRQQRWSAIYPYLGAFLLKELSSTNFAELYHASGSALEHSLFSCIVVIYFTLGLMWLLFINLLREHTFMMSAKKCF